MSRRGRRGKSLKELAEELLVRLSATKLNDIQGDLPPIDISDWDERPEFIVDPVIRMVYNLSLIEQWRALEGYTMQIAHADDDTANFVTVCNVSGRGFLVSIGASGDGSNDVEVNAKITIDGTVIEADETIAKLSSTGSGISHACFQGFDTSCKVEMKIDAASVILFHTVVMVED